MNRPALAAVMMANALVWATRSTCSGRVSVGAVLATKDGRIIATGYNGSPAGQPHCDEVGCMLDSDGHCVRSIHAEENAILQCAKNGVSSIGLTMYVTHSPCKRCMSRIIQAGIIKVLYLQQYGDAYDMLGSFKDLSIPVHPLSSNERSALNELLLTIYSDNNKLGYKDNTTWTSSHC